LVDEKPILNMCKFSNSHAQKNTNGTTKWVGLILLD